MRIEAIAEEAEQGRRGLHVIAEHVCQYMAESIRRRMKLGGTAEVDDTPVLSYLLVGQEFF